MTDDVITITKGEDNSQAADSDVDSAIRAVFTDLATLSGTFSATLTEGKVSVLEYTTSDKYKATWTIANDSIEVTKAA